MATYKWPYLELKNKVSIQDAAKEIGYVFDRSCGYKETTGQPTFIQLNGNDVTDRIVISRPNDNSSMIYFRHNEFTRNGKDVCHFIREHLDQFTQAAGASCEAEAIYKVMCHLANQAEKEEKEKKNGNDVSFEQHQTPKVPFELERWQRKPGDMTTAQFIMSQRALSAETGELFRNCIETVSDAQNQGKHKFRNLAFPYTKAGTPYHPDEPEQIIGYEIRGREFQGRPTFKMKAAGTDSVNGCWQAYIGKEPMPSHFEEIHLAESAYDLMAYVQLHPNKDYNNTLLVSVGGTFSTTLMMQLLEKYKSATPVLHFDNDLNGHIYDCRVAALMCGKTFRNSLQNKEVNIHVNDREFAIPMDEFTYGKFREASGLRPALRVEKPPQQYKDWNDVLRNAPLLNKQAEKARDSYPVSSKETAGKEDESESVHKNNREEMTSVPVVHRKGIGR